MEVDRWLLVGGRTIEEFKDGRTWDVDGGGDVDVEGEEGEDGGGDGKVDGNGNGDGDGNGNGDSEGWENRRDEACLIWSSQRLSV